METPADLTIFPISIIFVKAYSDILFELNLIDTELNHRVIIQIQKKKDKDKFLQNRDDCAHVF